MSQKDILEKVLEDYNDVFADIVNVLLFDGKEIVNEKELLNAKDKSQYKADDRVLHEQERDVAKFWTKGKLRIALCGLENQTKIDNDMPLRVIGYDGAAYRSELLGNAIERYPVITLVLYFGTRRWRYNRSLYQRLKIPDYLKRYVSDYRINVFEIAYLSDEQVRMFKSDFRFVADYFVQMRKNNDYIPSNETIKHVDELLKLMSVLTNDDRYAEILSESKGGERTMCGAMEKAVTRGRNEGKIEAYRDMGLSVSEIAKKVELSEDEVVMIIKNISK